MNHLARKIVGSVLVVLLLTGCGAAPKPAVEPGWTLYERPANGFAIALPATWKLWGDKSIDTIVQAAKKQNPPAATAWEQQFVELMSSDVTLLAGLDLAPGSAQDELATALVVARFPTDQSLDAYVKDYTGWLSSSGSAMPPVTHTQVALTAGIAEQVRFAQITTNIRGKAGISAITQYLIVKDKNLYMIALNSIIGQADKNAPVFEKIAQSLRWIK